MTSRNISDASAPWASMTKLSRLTSSRRANSPRCASESVSHSWVPKSESRCAASQCLPEPRGASQSMSSSGS
ncbi:Uncharacterised protein [Mycobacteroides abscessus subsp. abscessus]|nr:Uncharacterised protein [Mycobacteroides abscessus subsp. abscessus]